MSGWYELWLTDDRGMRIADRRGRTMLDGFLNFTASRIANDVGSLTLALPATFDTGLLRPDRMVQVWRGPVGGRLALWRVYLVRWWRLETRGRQEMITIGGRDTIDLLRRRIVAAYAGSDEASKSGHADDMMKEVVSEMVADGVDPTPTAGSRVWGDLHVQGDLGVGPELSKSFAFKEVLETVQAIAKAAREAGTEVFFDVVPDVVTSSSISFEFRTTTRQPGRDVSGSVVFDQARGNLADPFLKYDYSDAVNYVYALGQGQEDNRNVQQVYDADRYGVSQWARCEGKVEVQSDTDNVIREGGRAALADGRPRRQFGGVPLDTRGTRFGRDWDFGYKVRARYRGEEFDAIVRSVVLSVNGKGEETVQARLEYED